MVTTGCDQASSRGCEPLETLGSGPVKTREALEVCYKQLGGTPNPQVYEYEVRGERRQRQGPPLTEGILNPDLWLVPGHQTIRPHVPAA